MSYYYVIIAVLIVFKIIFWSFFCYVRNKRYSAARDCQRVIIVESVPTRRVIDNSDRATIVNNEVVPEPGLASAPPSYMDAMADKASKPPPYEQVI